MNIVSKKKIYKEKNSLKKENIYPKIKKHVKTFAKF